VGTFTVGSSVTFTINRPVEENHLNKKNKIKLQLEKTSFIATDLIRILFLIERQTTSFYRLRKELPQVHQLSIKSFSAK
jgi:hypothetical protein